MESESGLLKISFIGSGALAWHLGHQLSLMGHTMMEVYSPNPENCRAFASRIEAIPVTSINEMSDEVNLVFCCTPDDVLSQLGEHRRFVSATAVHCSGAAPLNALESLAPTFGVLYPFQSFTKPRKPNWSEIPILIEGSSLDTTDLLFQIARNLSPLTEMAWENNRIKLHLCGVFANNFSNAMLSAAHRIAELSGIETDWLFPLIRETFERSAFMHPMDAQTGPARRNDQNTIQRHLEMLKDSPTEASLYLNITNYLIRLYHGESPAED
jgi:predicted short-subunit dehydrogenase-like oxidoreductase (DUF2520 family)